MFANNGKWEDENRGEGTEIAGGVDVGDGRILGSLITIPATAVVVRIMQCHD